MGMDVGSSTLNRKRLVLLFWLLVAMFYFYLSIDYIRVAMNNDKLGEYVQKVVQLAGNEKRTPREIRALLMVRADELGVPLSTDQIRIQGSGQNLKVFLMYDVDIEVPILRSGVYQKHYEHQVSYRSPY
jgi:hypothetical protein